MPLGEVRSGMQCTGLSVVRGTEISSFDVEVLDVIADDPAIGGPRLLIRVSGPAIDATGVGPGFSGSPILCDGRNAGAISEGIGEYGNKVVLATPIEEILTSRPQPTPTGARRAPHVTRRARPLLGPLSVGGLSPGASRLMARAARRAGRVVLAAPPGPLGGYPPQDLQPGSAVGAAISSGDVSVGAIGTVAYRDGDEIFAFAHALDGLGERALFLQDAYVFGVIGNPVGIPDFGAITYKLTSSGGHPLGTFTNDTQPGIAGRLGAGPPAIPLHVAARERGAPGEAIALDSLLADERSLELGAGISFIAPLAAGTALDRLLRTFEPVTLTACTRFRIGGRDKPIGFCNPYFDPFDALTDIADASAMVDGFDFAPLDIRAVGVSIAAERGVVDEVLAEARAPRRVQAGARIPVRIRLLRRGGGRRTVTVRVRVPRNLRPGERTLVLEGNGFGNEFDFLIELIAGELNGPVTAKGAQARSAQTGPRTVSRLARRLKRMRRPLGITARFRKRDEPKVVLRSNDVRFDGRVKVSLRVRRARR